VNAPKLRRVETLVAVVAAEDGALLEHLIWDKRIPAERLRPITKT
jgi:hypothetical protein